MAPTAHNVHSVKAPCPDCGGALSIFDHKDASREFGAITDTEHLVVGGTTYTLRIWRFLLCSGCGRGALALMQTNGPRSFVHYFYPTTVPCAPLPTTVPSGICAEYRKAETSTSVKA